MSTPEAASKLGSSVGVHVPLGSPELFLTVVVENFNRVVLAVSPDFRVTWVNSTFTEVSGYALDEIIGRDPKEVLDLETLSSPVVAENRQRISGGRAFRGTVTFRAKDGQRIALKWEAHPVLDQAGQIVGFIGFEADRPSRRLLDREERDGSERLRALEAPLAVAVWERLVETDVMTYVSPSTSQFGHPVSAWYEPGFRTKIVDPLDRAAIRRTDHKVTLELQPWDLEYRLVRPDGRECWVHEIASVPESTTDGLLVRSVVQDITDRVLRERGLESAHETLKGREAWLSAILSANPECVLVIDPAFRMVKMNAAGLAMLEVPDFSAVDGVDVRRFASEATRGELEESVRSAFDGLEARAEFELIGNGGATRWVEQHAVMIEDPSRPVDGTYVLAVVRDVTARRRLDAERESARRAADAASRAKSDFMANMSHEMRTPLTAVIGFADVALDSLSRGDVDRAQLQGALETIRRASVHLAAIVEDVLDSGRIESGLLNVTEAPTNLSTLVSDVVELTMPDAMRRGLTLDHHTEPHVPSVIVTDATRVRQVLLNLTSNALKLTLHGGVRILLHQVPSADGLCAVAFDVIDSGPGIPPEQHESIFDRFHQADSTKTRPHGGLGLGLTISRGLARRLGGDVTLVESTVGVGSRFRFVLPIRLPPAIAESPAPTTPVPATPTGSEALSGRILVAEDGEDNRTLIVSVLRRAGAEVEVAEDGAVALAMLDESRRNGLLYDLLITDIQMPNLDGLGLARAVRGSGDELPIVALTALASEQDRVACLEAGCDDFASKPISRATLVDVTQRALSRWRSGHR